MICTWLAPVNAAEVVSSATAVFFCPLELQTVWAAMLLCPDHAAMVEFQRVIVTLVSSSSDAYMGEHIRQFIQVCGRGFGSRHTVSCLVVTAAPHVIGACA